MIFLIHISRFPTLLSFGVATHQMVRGCQLLWSPRYGSCTKKQAETDQRLPHLQGQAHRNDTTTATSLVQISLSIYYIYIYMFTCICMSRTMVVQHITRVSDLVVFEAQKNIPSGNLTQLLNMAIESSLIYPLNMVIFHSFLYAYQRVPLYFAYPMNIHLAAGNINPLLRH